MTRWAQAGGSSGDRYQERFDRLAAAGHDVHGEADLCSRLAPAGARVLDAGCGTGRVALELDRRGYRVVGVDIDERMLARAGRTASGVTWLRQDLASLDLAGLDVAGYDVVLAAGNVIPLVAAGTEHQVLANLAAAVRPGGLLVTGFGLDAGHLPLAEAPFGLAQYDSWCTAAGLTLTHRYATWDGKPYDDTDTAPGGGYAVNVHLRMAPTADPPGH